MKESSEPVANVGGRGGPWPGARFAILLGAGLLGTLAVMPYVLALLGELLTTMPLPPLPLLLAAQFLQSAVLLSIAIGVGLLTAGKIGLGAPILEAWLAGEATWPRLREMLRASVPAGISVGIVILLLVLFVFAPHLPQLPFLREGNIALWKRFLASFYGGIVEELLMRLFLLSTLAWLLSRVWRGRNASAGALVLWTANVVVAVLFGLGHLPTASLIMQITPLVVAAAILLNGIAGVTFGYLYWKHGLEAAMVAHFTADIVLHVMGPLFL